jgi:soluble lytic murein transglycosylase-like protein
MRTQELWGKTKLLSLSRRDGVMLFVGAAFTLAVVELVSLAHDSQTALPYQSAGINAPWIAPTVRHWRGTIDTMAARYNIDPNLIAIIMTLESGGDAKAKSYADAVGLMQITAPTAHDIANRYLKKPVKTYNLYDPTTSIEFGAAYLAYLRDQFGSAAQGPSWNSTVELVAAAYNGGPSAAESIEAGTGLNDTQTVVYSRDAFNMWRERHAADSPTFDRWKERGGSTLLQQAQADQSK